jgi:hypothetical protein
MHALCGVLVGVAGMVVAGGVPAGAAGASHPGDTRRASIVVRTYTQAESEPHIRTARRTASTILERAGIEIAWLECALPDDITAAAECQQALQWNELVVRIVSAGTMDDRRHLETLGFAFVDLDAGGGSLATVYADRVGLMAQKGGMDVAELLGRAMAHEIGHLLLGTNQHTRQGLMRASWSGADLRRNLATQWMFGGNEGEVMRSGIASRSRTSERR